MKRLLITAGNFFLVLVAVVCTMGALISGFSFSVDSVALYLIWLIAALVLTTVATLWRWKGFLISALPVIAVIYRMLPGALSGAKWVIFFITHEYNKWLRIPVLFSGAGAAGEITVFFAAAGIVLAYLLSLAVCVRRSALLTVFFTLPFVFLTFVLIEYPPETMFLIGLLIVCLTLLISGSMYPDDFDKKGMAVLPALALAILLLAAAFFIAPTDNDKRGEFIASVDSRLRSTVEKTGFTRANFGAGWPDIVSGIWSFNTEYVRVSDAGARSIANKDVLEVTASQPGTFYLRGYSMELFDGRSWYGNTDSQKLTQQEALGRAIPALIASLHSAVYQDSPANYMSISIDRSGDHSGVAYLPYFCLPLYDPLSLPQYGFFYFVDGEQYTVDFYSTEKSIAGLFAKLPSDVTNNTLHVYLDLMKAKSVYTEIDDSTADGLRMLAIEAGIDPFASRSEIADRVADYIASSARYTLTPYATPDGEDFALYFLRTSRQGYCIHFATAATLMLRALDIPARFTSGFVVTIPYGSANEPVTVTDSQAHAWVEVFYDDVGWIPLEVTPSTPGSGIPSRRPHTATESSPSPTDRPDDVYPDRDYDDIPENYFPLTPGPGGSPETQEQPEPSKSGFVALLITSCLAACVLLLIVRQSLIRKKRNIRFSQADTNQSVIYAWQYISRLERKRKPPDEIEELALKARFSQHRLSEDERALVISYASKRSGEMYRKYYLPGRLWLKYIRGL